MNIIEKERDNILRKLIFIFFYLILFDGVIRKWILPSFSAPIMMLKQVCVVLILLVGIRYWKLMSDWEKVFFFVGIVVFFTTLIWGHGNVIVAIYGCLPYWFGLPVCFIIGKVFHHDDFDKISDVVLYSSIINSILLLAQFHLPISHVLNYQGDDIQFGLSDYSISSLNGGFRPSGLFIHNSHTSVFQLLTFSILLYRLLFPRKKNNVKFLILVFLVNLTTLPFSISRTTIFYQIGLFLFIVFVFWDVKRKKLYAKLVLPVFIGLIVVIFVPVFRSALLSITARFVEASEVQYKGASTIEGTFYDIIERNIMYNIEAIVNPKTIDGASVPFWGYGQGMSTQVGARLMGLTQNSGFSLAEWDGLRIMCESGLVLGWIIILLRVGYAFRFLFMINRLKKSHNYISLFLMPIFLESFYLLSTWGNLFHLNFSIFIGGLFLSSLKFKTNLDVKKQYKMPNDH